MKNGFFDKMTPDLSLLTIAMRPRVVAILLLCSILACPLQLWATLGVVVVSKDGIVIGIDSRITGGRHPGLNCKVVHQGNIVIIASGTFDFLVDSEQFEFWDQAKQVLAHPAPIADTASALDLKIEPFLHNGLSALYKTKPYLYRLHYRKRSVLEFIVAGSDENGRLSAYHYRYIATTPGEFNCLKHAILPSDNAELRVEQIPMENPYATFSPSRRNSSQVADQIVEFIDDAKDKFPNAGIGDPVTTLVIDKNGARFLNAGKCEAK